MHTRSASESTQAARQAAVQRLTVAHTPQYKRTDRFGFFIPETPKIGDRCASAPTHSHRRSQSAAPLTPVHAPDLSAPDSATPGAAGTGSSHTPHAAGTPAVDTSGTGGPAESPAAGAGSDSAAEEDLPVPPREGPPASSGLYFRHTPPSAPLTAKEAKAQRARLLVENIRTRKWMAMVGDWATWSAKKPGKIKSRCRKGIPDAMRGLAWPLLTGSLKRKLQNKGLFNTLLRRPVPPKDEVLETIERDINRTYPLHTMFADAGGVGQTSLFRVLRAYAQYDKRVGYCQGMGFIAAMFLSYVPEEDAFFLLLSTMNFPPHSLTGLFSPGLPRVRVLEHQLESLLKTRMPKLHAHFAKEGIETSMYSAQWFLSLFTYNFPFCIVVRIWDSFLAEGWKVIFRVAAAVLRIAEPDLLKLSFEGILMYFRSLPAKLDPDVVMKTAFSFRLRGKDLDAFEAEYRALNAPSGDAITPASA